MAATTSRPAEARSAGPRSLPPATSRRHLAWLVAGIAVSFALPYVLADRLDLPRDLYYGLYGAGVLALFAGWVRDTGQSMRVMVSRRLGWAIGLGLLAAAAWVASVFGSEYATSGPSGIELAGASVRR